MSKKVLFIFLLVVLLTSVVVFFDAAPAAAQGPGYVWPQPWQTDPSYNQGVVQAAQEQWGQMSPFAAQKWTDQPVVDAWNQELQAEIAARAAAAASAVANTTITPILMVNPSAMWDQTTYYSGGGYTTTSYWDWGCACYRTVNTN